MTNAITNHPNIKADMQQILVLLLSLLLTIISLISFAWGEDQANRIEDHAHSIEQHSNDHSQGEKWNADAHTVKLVEEMKKASAKFTKRRKAPTLLEFQALGNVQQVNLDRLIQGCTMSGPAHDQLHNWISDLAPKIQRLSKAKTAVTANASFEELERSIDEFGHYFH